jgi:uncharacterized protein YgbK (DUF1537 family)
MANIAQHEVRHFDKKTDAVLRRNIGAELTSTRDGAGKTVGAVPSQPEDVRALVLDIESRHDAPDVARDKVALAIRQQEAQHIYKKTDSVLRGNIGSELAALRDTVGETVCFVPFYPAQGRITRGGVQMVGGVRVDRSAFAQDPRNPVVEAHIPTLLREAGLCATVLAPPYALPPVLPDVLVFDGETDADLAAAADFLLRHALLRATAGCAGFAAYLPSVLETGNAAPRAETMQGALFILSGSAAEATRTQVTRARKAGIITAVPTAEVWQNDARGLADAHWQDKIAACADALAQGQSTILASAEEGTELLDRAAFSPGFVQEKLLDWADSVIEQSGVVNVMIIGGDLLLAFLRRHGIQALRPLSEAAPGVPICEAGGLRLLTKSGGFGDCDLLLCLTNELRQ